MTDPSAPPPDQPPAPGPAYQQPYPPQQPYQQGPAPLPGPGGYPPPGYPAATSPYSPIVGRPLIGDEATWGMLSHLSIFALSLIGPIIVMLTKGKESPFIRYHAVEALNMHLTLLIIDAICFALFLLILPILIIIAAGIAAMIYGILAAMAANRGEAYRYPMIWRMVK